MFYNALLQRFERYKYGCIAWFLASLVLIIFNSMIRKIAHSMHTFARGKRLTPIQIKHRDWWYNNRIHHRLFMILNIYFLGIVAGIIFDSIIKYQLGVLLLLNFIGMLNDEISDLLHKCITKFLLKNRGIGEIYSFLYLMKPGIYLALVFTILSVLKIIYAGVSIYLYELI